MNIAEREVLVVIWLRATECIYNYLKHQCKCFTGNVLYLYMCMLARGRTEFRTLTTSVIRKQLCVCIHTWIVMHWYEHVWLKWPSLWVYLWYCYVLAVDIAIHTLVRIISPWVCRRWMVVDFSVENEGCWEVKRGPGHVKRAKHFLSN